MSYDSQCYDLAEAFLSDIQNPVNKDDAHKLAQDIQDVIEDYLSDVEARDKAQPDEPPPALKLEIQRDLDGAVRYGKVFGDFLDSMLSPKRS